MFEDLLPLLARSPAPQTLWGLNVAPPLHLGYDALLVAQKQLMAAGFDHKVLLADYNTQLTHGLSPEQTEERCVYYEQYLDLCLGLGVDIVRGSEFQNQPGYLQSFFALSHKLSPGSIARHLPVSATERKDDTRFGAYLSVVMQALDAQYLGVDAVIADDGQKKAHALAARHSEEEQAVPCIFLPTGTDIAGRPLRLSTGASRISIHETPETLANKVRKMYAPPPGQDPQEGRSHALMEFFQWSVFPWRESPVVVRGERCSFCEYTDFATFARDYGAGLIAPNHTKHALTQCLLERLGELQDAMQHSASWVDLDRIIGAKQST